MREYLCPYCPVRRDFISSLFLHIADDHPGKTIPTVTTSVEESLRPDDEPPGDQEEPEESEEEE